MDRVKVDLRMLGITNGGELAVHSEAWREIAEAVMWETEWPGMR